MLKEEIIANKGYAVFCVKEDDQIDDIAVRVLRQDCPDFLLTIKTISIDGETELRYELADGVRMSYQQPQMSKKEFAEQMLSMLLPFKNCGDWLLDYHYLYLDPQYIFINTKEQAVRYIYLPVRSCKASDREIKDFFINFALSVELRDDRDFILRILRQLRNEHTNLLTVLGTLQNEIGSSCSVGAVSAGVSRNAASGEAALEEKRPQKKAFLGKRESEKPKSVDQGGGAQSGQGFEKAGERKEEASVSPEKFGGSTLAEELLKKISGGETEAKADKKKEKKGKKEKEKPPAAGGSSKKGLISGLIKKKDKSLMQEELMKAAEMPKQESEIQREPVVSGDFYPVDGDFTEEKNRMVLTDETEMAEEDFGEADTAIVRLHLEEAGGYTAPREIELNMEKGYVTVGRYDKSGNPCSDYNFDHCLTFVSRNHFRIERYGDGYRIIDLDSKNGTLLNGRELVKNMVYDLNPGDTISISRKVRLTYRVL